MKPFFARFSDVGYVCAHRGARSIAPENTFLAFELARTCGADLIETDVQVTADGELVVLHDHTLERTTDIKQNADFAGRSHCLLSDFTFAELQQLDAGSWFLDSDPFGSIASGVVLSKDYARIKNQKVPLLRDVLISCRNNDFPVNLELKDQTCDFDVAEIVRRVIGLIDATGTENIVLVSAFNHDYLRELRLQNSTIATAALVEDNHPENLLPYLIDLGVDAYHPAQSLADAGLIRLLVAAGIKVNPWVVNAAAQWQNFVSAGATFICTDWPQQMVAVSRS